MKEQEAKAKTAKQNSNKPETKGPAVNGMTDDETWTANMPGHSKTGDALYKKDKDDIKTAEETEAEKGKKDAPAEPKKEEAKAEEKKEESLAQKKK